MSSSEQRAHANAVNQIFAYLGRYGITPDDLINIGGDDLKSSNAGLRAKAQRVEKSWALMASLGVVFRDLEAASGEVTAERPSRPPNGSTVPKDVDNQALNASLEQTQNPLKTNDNRDNAPIEVSVKGAAGAKIRWQHKRRLKPAA